MFSRNLEEKNRIKQRDDKIKENEGQSRRKKRVNMKVMLREEQGCGCTTSGKVSWITFEKGIKARGCFMLAKENKWLKQQFLFTRYVQIMNVLSRSVPRHYMLSELECVNLCRFWMYQNLCLIIMPDGVNSYTMCGNFSKADIP